MKNHFLISYSGNKRDEVERIYNNIDFDDKKIIIEPFCGSCALSVYIALKHPKKYKYIINDNDKYLIELIKLAKNKKKFDKFINEINNICFKDNQFINKEIYYNLIKQDNLKGWYISKKFYQIRQGLYPLKKVNKINLDGVFIDFIRNENVIIKNDDAITLINEYKDNKECIIFLDPPYLNSCNDFYLNHNTNVYEYIYKHLDDLKMYKSFIILCLEDIWIIRLLFDKLKDSFIIYEKLYQITKRKTNHIIITNH
jgi:site-specific DNA-adenine methylase